MNEMKEKKKGKMRKREKNNNKISSKISQWAACTVLDGGTDPAERPPQSSGQLVKVSRHGLLMNVHHVC